MYFESVLRVVTRDDVGEVKPIPIPDPASAPPSPSPRVVHTRTTPFGAESNRNDGLASFANANPLVSAQTRRAVWQVINSKDNKQAAGTLFFL